MQQFISFLPRSIPYNPVAMQFESNVVKPEKYWRFEGNIQKSNSSQCQVLSWKPRKTTVLHVLIEEEWDFEGKFRDFQSSISYGAQEPVIVVRNVKLMIKGGKNPHTELRIATTFFSSLRLTSSNTGITDVKQLISR